MSDNSCAHFQHLWVSPVDKGSTMNRRLGERAGWTHIRIPCGRCFFCRKKKASEWSLRCQHELQAVGGLGSFVTLTYDDAHLHFGDSQCPILFYRDVQLFHKRLRKAGYKFRFICAGEYGEKTFRPHYHFIYFGLIMTDEIVHKYWPHGVICDCSPVRDMGAVGNYCASYTVKKIRSNIPVPPEAPQIIRCSQGIGKAWFVKHYKSVVNRGFCYLGKFKKAIPRYYRKILKLLDGFLSDDLDFRIYQFTVGRIPCSDDQGDLRERVAILRDRSRVCSVGEYC